MDPTPLLLSSLIENIKRYLKARMVFSLRITILTVAHFLKENKGKIFELKSY